jgi:DGQHR domain-containing protein
MKLQLPAIGYIQGGRRMCVTAMSPDSLLKTVQRPEVWNPLGKQAHGNRPINKPHQAGIADYLEDEERFVIGAVMLYASPSEASFVPAAGQDDEERQIGTLFLEYGAMMDIGDGQHRIGAYGDVLAKHNERGDPVFQRLHSSGQPVIVVIDDNPLHRAQDFTDLQRNAKPPTASLSMSMDRRQAVNRLLISLVEDPEIPIFGGGERVEFLSDTPGKYSAKLYSFKSVRYASGLMLGVNERVPKRWDERANALLAANGAGAELKAFWRSLGELPAFADVLTGKERATSRLREQTYLASSGVLYAIAWGAYLSDDTTAFVKGLGKVSFARPTDKDGKVATKGTGKNGEFTRADTILAGTLVDERGKISGAQNAWEAAADVLRDAATK